MACRAGRNANETPMDDGQAAANGDGREQS